MIGTVRITVTLPLRAEKTATVPTAKLPRSTGAIDYKERKTPSHQVTLGLISFRAFGSAGTSAELSVNYVKQVYRKEKKKIHDCC